MKNYIWFYPSFIGHQIVNRSCIIACISSQEAAEKARRSSMTKGTAGAADTGSEYEQGAAGANK